MILLRACIFASLLFGMGHSVFAGVVVNEVYVGAREPIARVGWIELYNNSDSFAVVSGSTLKINEELISIADLIIVPHGYSIVADTAYGPSAFESNWGDNSGVWGDVSFESSFSIFWVPLRGLGNTNSVELYDAIPSRVSLLEWTTDSDSVRSWERVSDLHDSAIQCQFIGGGTPGETNSTDSVESDVAIESLTVSRSAGACKAAITIRNYGIAPSLESELLLQDRIDYGGGLLEVLGVPPLASGAFVTLIATIYDEATYRPAIAILARDNRVTNNHASFMVLGNDYPPTALSEIMAAPSQNGGGEWIELILRSDTAIDLRGWSIRDVSNKGIISDTTLFLNDTIAIVCQSKALFEANYGVLDVPIIDSKSWVSFNNSGDIVTLIDPFGIVADECRYQSTAVEDVTFARNPEFEPGDAWHTSVDRGGTPGAANMVLEEAMHSISLNAIPQTISPDGDGIDDNLQFHIVAPPSVRCTLRLFDRNGHMVRVLLSDVALSSNDIAWDGLDAAGARLPIGLYVALLESSDGKSARIPIVVAR